MNNFGKCDVRFDSNFNSSYSERMRLKLNHRIIYLKYFYLNKEQRKNSKT